MTIKIKIPCAVFGVHREPGEVVEAPEEIARSLVAMARAEICAPPVIQVREPEIINRDPVVAEKPKRKKA